MVEQNTTMDLLQVKFSGSATSGKALTNRHLEWIWSNVRELFPEGYIKSQIYVNISKVFGIHGINIRINIAAMKHFGETFWSQMKESMRRLLYSKHAVIGSLNIDF